MPKTVRVYVELPQRVIDQLFAVDPNPDAELAEIIEDLAQRTLSERDA